MADNWWDAAPLAPEESADDGAWWKAAPLAEQPTAEDDSWWKAAPVAERESGWSSRNRAPAQENESGLKSRAPEPAPGKRPGPGNWEAGRTADVDPINPRDFDARLTADERDRFDAWKREAQAKGVNVGTEDYDLQGWWKNRERDLGPDGDTGHFSDKYKKWNHPTFSEESQFSSPQHQGGKWTQAADGRDVFTPGPENLKRYTPDQIRDYFAKNEPDAILDLDGRALSIAKGTLEFGKGIPGTVVRGGGSMLKAAADAHANINSAPDEAYFYLKAAATGEITPEQVEKAAEGMPVDQRKWLEYRLGFVKSHLKDGDRAAALEYVESYAPKDGAETPLYQSGMAVQKFADTVLPAAPGYKDSPGRMLGEAAGSMGFGMAAAALGGPIAGATAFAALGADEAADRARRDGAGRDEVETATTLGALVGTTNILPVETLLGKLPLPFRPAIERAIAKFGAGEVTKAVSRVGEQTLIEMLQEGGEQGLQNLIAREIYKPEQSLTEGVLPAGGLGAGVGGIAQTIKEVGGLALESFAGRRGGRNDPGRQIYDAIDGASINPDATNAAAVARMNPNNYVPPITDPTPEDIASPIPTDLIQRGKQAVANAQAGIKPPGEPPTTPPPVGGAPAGDSTSPLDPIIGAATPTPSTGWSPVDGSDGYEMNARGAVRKVQATAPPLTDAPSGDALVDMTPEKFVDGMIAGKWKGDTPEDRQHGEWRMNNAVAVEQELARRASSAQPAAPSAVAPPADTTTPATETATQQAPAAKTESEAAARALTTGAKFDMGNGYSYDVLGVTDFPDGDRSINLRDNYGNVRETNISTVKLMLDRPETTVTPARAASAPAPAPTFTVAPLNDKSSVITGDVDVGVITQTLGRKPLFNAKAQGYVVPTARVEDVRAALTASAPAPAVDAAPVQDNAPAAAAPAAVDAPAREITVDAELLSAATADTTASPYRATLDEDAAGVIPGKPRALDSRATSGEYSLDEVAAGWTQTRTLLKQRYGETVTLYRADAPTAEQSPDTQTVLMGDKALAERFAVNSRTAEPQSVNVDDIVAVYARPSGYYEFVVKKPAATATAPVAAEGGIAPPVTTQAPTTAFTPDTYIPAAREYIATGKPLSGMDKALGLTPQQTTSVLTKIAGEKGSGIFQVRGKVTKDKKGNVKLGKQAGTFRRVPTDKGPVDVVTFLQRLGGIRDDEGHDLRKGRNLQRTSPNNGALILDTGMSIDAAGGAMHQAGYFGPPETTPRPTEDDVLQMLERASGGNKVYTPEEGASAAAAREAKNDEASTKERRAAVKAAAKARGEMLPPADIDAVANIMADSDMDADAAVVDYAEAVAIRAANDGERDSGDTGYDDQTIFDGIPFDEYAYDQGQDEPRPGDPNDGPLEVGPEGEAGNAGQGGEGGAAAAEVRGQELGGLFGDTPAPKTKAPKIVEEDGELFAGSKALSTAPKAQGRAPQRDADEGLFGAPDEDGGDVPLFSRRRPDPAKTAEAVGISGLRTAFQIIRGATFQTGRDMKIAVQGRVQPALRAAGLLYDGKAKPSLQQQEMTDYLAAVGLADARFALEQNANAVGWYDEKVTKALRVLTLIHPELATDRQAKFSFIWALAVTSNGLKVNKNFELAEQAYRTYKQTGKMPTDIGTGTAADKINGGLKLHDLMIDRMGFEALEAFMTTKRTVGQIKKMTGFEPSGEAMGEVVFGASILGPKIGNGFFANLYGHFDQLTMDRWLIRTWGRWTATLIEKNAQQTAVAKDRLVALMALADPDMRRALSKIVGRPVAGLAPARLADAIKEASTNKKQREAMNALGADKVGALTAILGAPQKNQARLSLGDEIRKAGNSLWKYMDGQKEQPAGPNERQYIRAVFGQMLADLKNDHPSLTMADLQALLWYPEKRLYDAAKKDDAEEGYSDDEAPDYANAAARLARANGVSQSDIDAATAAVDRELAAGRRAGGPRRADADVGSQPGERGQAAPVGDGPAFSRRQTGTSAFQDWFGDSKVVDESGKPLRVYRGEHGATDGKADFQSRIGSLTFTANPETASTYALDPNDWNDTAEQPRTIPVYLKITKPFINQDSDPFLEFADLAKAVGREAAAEFFVRYGGSVQGTGNWMENFEDEFDSVADVAKRAPERMSELYADAFQFLDDPEVVEALKAAGYDGAIHIGNGESATELEYRVFHPNQIKSAIGNSGAFSQTDDRIAFSTRESPFYSAALRAAENLPQAKGNGLQMLALLRKQPGVKPEELDLLDVVGFLGDRKGVTREELAEYIRDNQVVVEEVTKQALQPLTAMDEAWMRLVGQRIDDGEYVSPDERSEYQRLADRQWNVENGEGGDTKFAQWALPGGTDYREMLITLPEKDGVRRAKITEIQNRYETGTMQPGDEAEFERLTAEVPGANEDYRGGHYDEANVLAHIRFNERTNADGKRMLFIEEIQSDWHQQGRKQGYRDGDAWSAFQRKGFTVEQDGDFWMIYEPGGDPVSEGRTRQQAIDDLVARDTQNVTPMGAASESGVPDAPLKKTWHETAFRRAVAYAAENGFDSVAWTTGEQQAARYDLSKHISKINYERVGGSLYEVEAYDLNDKRIIAEDEIGLDRVEELFGKEMAEKIREDVGTDAGTGPYREWKTLEGLDLKVGGEGMKGFYDQIIPAYANKWGKRFGARVGETQINADGKMLTVHSMPITPEMRAAVQAEGVPLFKKPDAAAELTDAFTGQAPATYDALRAEMDKVGLSRVDLRVENSIFTDGKGISFSAQPGTDKINGFFWRNTIGVALDADDGTAFTLNHEIVHGLASTRLFGGTHGLFLPAEWSTMERAVRGDKARMANIRGRYPDLTDAQQVEEAIADMYAGWRRGDYEAKGFIAAAFKKIAAFLEALGNALRGNGFNTAADVFTNISSGTVGARGAATAQGGAAAPQFSRQQTGTDAFKAWFGGSKVVDADGKPLVVYHGTGGDFDQFRPGSYFTTDSSEAGAYTFVSDLRRRERATGKYKIISQPSLAGSRLEYWGTISDIDSPDMGKFYATDNGVFRFDGKGRWSVVDDIVVGGVSDFDGDLIRVHSGDAKDDAQETVDSYEAAVQEMFPRGEGGNVRPVYLSIKNPKEMSAYEGNRLGRRLGADDASVNQQIAELKAQGYDGIVTESDDTYYIFNPDERRPTHYIALHPNQIKSAIGNSGAFDPNDDRIAFSRRTDDPAEAPTQAPPPVAPDTSFPPTDEPFAGNINLANIKGVEDIAAVLVKTAADNAEFMGARRGVQSHEMTKALADSMGMTVEQLTGRNKGQAFNAEQALAARQMLAASADDMMAISRKVAAEKANGITDNNTLFEFERSYLRHVAIQEQVAGMTAEAGRALNAFRIVAESSRLKQANIAALLLGKTGDIAKLAEQIAAIEDGDISTINKKSREEYKPTWWDKAMEIWINFLLSNAPTHTVNIVSNTIFQLWQIPENLVTAGVGAARGNPDRMRAREVAAQAAGLLQGAADGAKAAWHTLLTEEPSDEMSKIEATRHAALGNSVAAQVVRIPGRLLSTSDEFFKGVANRTQLNGLAVRQGLKEGLSGKALADRVAALVEDPTDEMLLDVRDYQRYVTFTSELGEVGKAVQSVIAAMPPLKIVLPFIRTPTNLMKRTIERTPLALLAPSFWNAKGLDKDKAIARLITGSAIGALIITASAAGMITGGGDDDKDRLKEKMATGWRPYSLKIGDLYIPYARMDPFSSIMGLYADLGAYWFQMTDQERDGAAGLITASLATNLVNKTYLRGVVELANVVADPQRYGPKYIGNLVGTVIPGGVAGFARWNDPFLRDRHVDPTLTGYQKEMESLLNTLRSRNPAFSDTLPATRDMWGRAIKRDENVAPGVLALASPFVQSRENPDKVRKEVDRLEMGLSMPQRKMDGVEMTPREYDRYIELAGKSAHKMLTRRMMNVRWGRMPDAMKRDRINDEIRYARDDAKRQLLREYPRIKQARRDADRAEIIELRRKPDLSP